MERGIWYKLVKSNVKGKTLNVIQSMCVNIKSCVMLNNELSETFVCNTGVRQGENLSPDFLHIKLTTLKNFLTSYVNSLIFVIILLTGF